MTWKPEIVTKLGEAGSFPAAFKLADMFAYLLDPNDLTNYSYSEVEKRKFHATLERELEEV